ncbi:MAG: MFS transporter [Acidobacteria bacterium]|nr:MFS transporter [Acidobacteriota bacterium]
METPVSLNKVAESSVAAADSIAERVRRRVTWRLSPYLLLLYLIAYIDRTNIGVAALGMKKSMSDGGLAFNDAIIGLGSALFFLGYFLLEIPGTLIVEKWSARKWIARIMISWGLVATLMGFIGMPWMNFASEVNQFYTLRVVLGLAEAGFFPGVVVYLSHWFRYEDRAKAKAKFMIGIPLASIIGVPISRWIMETVNWGGLAGWRWVFILEGIPSVILGIITIYYLTDKPQQAKWLPEDEKQWLVAELERERQLKQAQGKVSMWEGFKHPQILLLMMVYFFAVTANYGLTFFLPSITDAMKSLSIVWQTVATTLPYVATLLAMLFIGRNSDRTKERRWHTVVPIFLAGVGLVASVLTGDYVALTITALCLAGSGFSYHPAFWTLPSAFLTGAAAAASVGLINSVGNLGGFLGPYIVGYLKNRTGNFTAAMWFMGGCALFAALLATQLRPPKK